jgi:hypothetical protein
LAADERRLTPIELDCASGVRMESGDHQPDSVTYKNVVITFT